MLVLAIVFAVRAARFFLKSQEDRAPRLEAYQPRAETREERVEYVGGVMPSATMMIMSSGMAMPFVMMDSAVTTQIFYQGSR